MGRGGGREGDRGGGREGDRGWGGVERGGTGEFGVVGLREMYN